MLLGGKDGPGKIKCGSNSQYDLCKDNEYSSGVTRCDEVYFQKAWMVEYP